MLGTREGRGGRRTHTQAARAAPQLIAHGAELWAAQPIRDLRVLNRPCPLPRSASASASGSRSFSRVGPIWGSPQILGG